MTLEINKAYCEDTYELLEKIDDSVIDAIVSDPPYGVTQNKADKPLNFKRIWEQYKRIRKPTTPIILTSQFPYTLDLILSNKKEFKYDLIWDKELTSGFLNANRMPLRSHEHILIFYDKPPTYNPQKTRGEPNHTQGVEKKNRNRNYGERGFVDNYKELGDMKHPKSIIRIQKVHPSKAFHPTEKPVKLGEFLIKSYSNEGDIILDNTVGVGWSAVASKMNSRNFIVGDHNPDYINETNKRLMEIL